MNTSIEIVSMRFEISPTGTLATVEWLETLLDPPDNGTKVLQVRSAMFSPARTVQDILATDIAQLQFTVWPFDPAIVGNWPVLEQLAPHVVWQNDVAMWLCAPAVLPLNVVLQWANETRPFARGVEWKAADMSPDPNPQPCPRLQAHQHWVLTR